MVIFEKLSARDYVKQSLRVSPIPGFISQNQWVFEGFESPFEKKLNPEDRWYDLHWHCKSF